MLEIFFKRIVLLFLLFFVDTFCNVKHSEIAVKGEGRCCKVIFAVSVNSFMS